MTTMHLNWKRSLATLALLAVATSPEAPVAVAQSDNAAPAPAVAEEKPAPRYLTLDPKEGVRVELYTNAATGRSRTERRPGRERPSGAGLAAGAAPRESPTAHGAKVAAKLKQIILDQVRFDGLPLGEVLIYLNDESLKRDPDKTGINFLINPNARPVALTGKVDPATGLPEAAATEFLDVGGVVIKFNQPLRNVAMKDLLDAIVMVADHPIEYTLEDYGVVFAAKRETLAGQPVVVARAQEPAPQQSIVSSQSEPSPRKHWSDAELSEVKPQPFNVDFGSGSPSGQEGPAALGKPGDFWNGVSEGFNEHYTKGDLKFAAGDPSPIEVEMINLGGGWGIPGALGGKSPMLENYNYPTGNRGGNSTVLLHHVPAGKYQVYVYGAGASPGYYGDYTLSAGGREYGRKQTSKKGDAMRKPKWAEGCQYVRFSGVKVERGEDVKVFIQPGAAVTDGSGRSFADAFIAGLQLIPVK
jgi:hypothetical protein